jgi:hypothetical protein
VLVLINQLHRCSTKGAVDWNGLEVEVVKAADGKLGLYFLVGSLLGESRCLRQWIGLEEAFSLVGNA